MANQKKKLGAFRLAHLIGCVALVFWSYWFYTEYTPARAVWRNMTIAQEQRARLDAASTARGQRPAIRQKIVHFKAKYRAIKPIVLPDVFVGTAVLVFFSVSTGVFVKRLDVFLRMSGSGDVASVRGIGIQSQTLESNMGRKGGIQ